MSRRGRLASDRLTQALIAMAAEGLRPNCSDPGSHWMWLSEHPQERQLAALMCGGCQVLTECGDAAEANGERFGTWAGRDRTRAPGKAAAA
jgi:Transcription factor WhiB